MILGVWVAAHPSLLPRGNVQLLSLAEDRQSVPQQGGACDSGRSPWVPLTVPRETGHAR